MQLLQAKYIMPSGSSWRRTSVVFNGSGLVQLTDSEGIQISAFSGVVVRGAFYISWTSGSGIRSAHIGRITGDSELVLTESPAYRFDAPPFDLMLREVRGVITVERARAKGFNLWEDGQVVGTMRDEGSRLAIVNRDGQEMAPDL
jgi:hypothetical protein